MTSNSYTHELRSTWETNAESFLEQLDLKHRDTDVIRNGFKQLISEAVTQSHAEWELHNPCPECGSTTMFRWVSFPELARHENDSVAFQDGSNCSTEFAWECADCDEILTVSPASIATPGMPGDIDWGETPALESLETALREHCVGTEWTPGNPCSVCDSEYIGEAPIDAYTGTVTGDNFEQDHFGDRITTTKYWCDACGETLSQNLGGVLSRALSL